MAENTVKVRAAIALIDEPPELDVEISATDGFDALVGRIVLRTRMRAIRKMWRYEADLPLPTEPEVAARVEGEG